MLCGSGTSSGCCNESQALWLNWQRVALRSDSRSTPSCSWVSPTTPQCEASSRTTSRSHTVRLR
eukprot:5475323-Alexandrium_andersonii.AAC.1